MNSDDYLRALRRYWLGVVSLTLLGLLTAGVVTFTMPRVYTADASGFVTAQTDGSIGEASLVDSFSRSRAKSYVELARNREVADRVIRALGLETTSQALVGRITATVPIDTVTLRISATAPTPQEALDLANAWIVALSEEIREIESPTPATNTGEGAVSSAVVGLIPQEAAVLPSAPSSPNTQLNLALGGLAGLALGSGYALLRYSRDKRIRSADTIEREFEVAVIGTLPIDKELRRDDVRLIASTSASSKNPNMRFAEALRELRTNIQFVNIDHPPRVIVMTSPSPQDGKSTVAANLALAIAEAGRRVILVDADLRRPTVAKTFGLTAGAGLTDLLVGAAQVSDVLRNSSLSPQLWVLPSGTIPPNPSEMLGSQMLADLIRQLSEHAIVILDTPPLLPVTDGALLTARTDGAIITVVAGKTRLQELAKALANIRRVNGRVLGIIINRVPTRGADSKQYGYYGKQYGYVSTPSQSESDLDDLVESLSRARS